MAHAAQPKHSVWIYRANAETFLRFTADVANVADTSTTFYTQPDGTVSFAPSNTAPAVNYVRNLTADPKVLKRIWTDGTTGHSSLQVNTEANANAPAVNAYAVDGVTGDGTSLDLNPHSVTAQAAGPAGLTVLQLVQEKASLSTPKLDVEADTVYVNGRTAATALNLFLGDIKMDIFSPVNNAVIIYDIATNTYKALDGVYTKQQIDILLAGNTGVSMPVPFSYAYVAGQLTYPLPADCTGLLSLTASTGQTANPLSGWTVNTTAKTFTLTAPMPDGVTYMYGHGLRPNTALSSYVNILDFAFKPGFSDTYDTVASAGQAGVYRSYAFTNVLSATYTVNGVGVSLPFQLQTGNTLQVTIVRNNANAPSTVTLTT